MIPQAIDYQGGQIYVDKTVLMGLGYVVIENKRGEAYPFEYEVKNLRSSDRTSEGYKIVAQSPNLSIEGIPYVEIEEEDVEQLALKEYPYRLNFTGDRDGNEEWRRVWVKGYKVASAKKYTEEDLRLHATRFAHLCRLKGATTNNDTVNLFDTEYLQSLQPKVVSIEVETNESYIDDKLSILSKETSEAVKAMCIIKPITYTKELRGKMETFLKVKKVNYE